MKPSPLKVSFTKLDFFLLAIAAVFIYLLVFRLPFYPFFYQNDQLIFLYNADRMYHGEAIYRDFFQFTFPGAQTLYCVLFLIFGPKFFLAPLVALVTGVLLFAFGTALSKL